jgi:hypothetical protein
MQAIIHSDPIIIFAGASLYALQLQPCSNSALLEKSNNFHGLWSGIEP